MKYSRTNRIIACIAAWSLAFNSVASQSVLDSALSRSSYERYAASQSGTDSVAPWLAFGGMSLAVGVSPQLFAASQTLTAVQIKSAGSAQFQTTNGTINLGAATTGESLKFEFGVDDKGRNLGRQYINQSTQTGTSIQTGGNLSLSANQNIQGTAATIQAGGTANLNAGGNIALVEGRTTKSEDLNWLETRKDLTSSSTKRTSSTSDQSTAITTTISGASGVNMQAQGGTLLLSGANVSSTGGNVALSGAEVIIASTQNGQNNTRTIDEKKTGASLSDIAGIVSFGALAPIANAGRGINAQSKDNAMAGDTTLVQTSITGQNVQVTSTAGNISLKAAALNATGTGSAAGTVTLDAGTNAVNLQTLQTSNYQSTSKETSDVLWQAAKGSGSQNQNTNYNQINGKVALTADKVNIEGAGTTLTQAAQTLALQPGMGYLNQLANDPALKDKINWQKVDEAHKNWNYDQQGLSPTGAAIVSLAVAYATGGAGGGIVSAGMSTLASQATVSLINNGGDIGKTLEQMGSSQSLRGIAMSMVTAGVLQGLPNLLPADMQSVMGATAKSGFTDLLAKNLTNSLATAVVTSAINDSSLEEALKQNVISAIINTGMAKTANAIGDAASNKNETIKLNEFGRSVAHAIAGCIGGAAKANSGDGCSAGAVGAVVGELAAQFYNDGTETPKADTVQFAALMSGIAGAVVGGDARSVNLAAATGGNAAANNYLMHNKLIDEEGELRKLKLAKDAKQCDAICDARIAELQELDAKRDREIRPLIEACQVAKRNNCEGEAIAQHYAQTNGLGAVSMRYESNPGTKGSPFSFNNCAPGDKGGCSYGPLQIAANTGLMDAFMKNLKDNPSPEAQNFYATITAAGGVEAAKRGDANFLTTWTRLTASDPQFVQYQMDTLINRNLYPVVLELKQIGINFKDLSAAQKEMLFSAAVQHGSGTEAKNLGLDNLVERTLSLAPMCSGDACPANSNRPLPTYTRKDLVFGEVEDRMETAEKNQAKLQAEQVKLQAEKIKLLEQGIKTTDDAKLKEIQNKLNGLDSKLGELKTKYVEQDQFIKDAQQYLKEQARVGFGDGEKLITDFYAARTNMYPAEAGRYKKEMQLILQQYRDEKAATNNKKP